MKDLIIYCDDLNEGIWFKSLNSIFEEAELIIIPSNVQAVEKEGLSNVLQYDRPDIVLKHKSKVIFVLERTSEVPSGHNVGQRFGRLVAAAKEETPVVYLGPYAAYKHGGETAGPRYMNLRLFYALKKLSEHYNTAITTINWPVDTNYRIIKTSMKDIRIKEYLNLFFSYYQLNGFKGLSDYILNSDFQKEQYNEQIIFAKREVRNPEQYDTPPASVEIITKEQFVNRYPTDEIDDNITVIVLYHVGMTYIRSDPYAGMSALYKYLYVTNSTTMQISNFSEINSEEWYTQRKTSKTYRMFKEFSDAILFKNGLIFQPNL